LKQALDDCSRALRLNPNYLPALVIRGFVNLKLNQLDSAIADYDAALKINPKGLTRCSAVASPSCERAIQPVAMPTSRRRRLLRPTSSNSTPHTP